jgi:gamma-glutamylcyclotransferase (GGCT)/AIG2-like uncharacterized protein YtfP
MGLVKATTSYYGAYGSNLNHADWRNWCADAGIDPSVMQSLGPAWFPDKELAFRIASPRRKGGVLDLRDRCGQATAGWLYAVTEDGWAALDVKEGTPHFYQRVSGHALTSDGNVVNIQTYAVTRDRQRPFVVPAASYVTIVRTGREELGIAEDGHLQAAADDTPRSWLIPRVFVYGTCRPGQPRFEVLRGYGVQEICPGTVGGTLVDLGPWPGLVSGLQRVRGEVVSSVDPGGLLQALDEIEGFSGWGTSDNLFTRTLMSVHTSRGPVLAWVYRYAQPCDGVSRVTSGDWTNRV